MTETVESQVMLPLSDLAPSQQVRDQTGTEEELELRLHIDELERSMWIDLARGIPFWSTLVVQHNLTKGNGQPPYLIVDGERRFRALRRLRPNLARELANAEWDAEQKDNIARG